MPVYAQYSVPIFADNKEREKKKITDIKPKITMSFRMNDIVIDENANNNNTIYKLNIITII